MKYIIITLLFLLTTLIFLSGCVSNTIELSKLDTLPPVSAESVNSGQDELQRQKAQDLGIAYVDYLHMVNNSKTRTTKSFIKLRHTNNE
jgi:hypothetical protein|tara:strand:- start:365 stop:631 length:267 start_codon:yes stop_codon:yes gene_type:complete